MAVCVYDGLRSHSEGDYIPLSADKFFTLLVICWNATSGYELSSYLFPGGSLVLKKKHQTRHIHNKINCAVYSRLRKMHHEIAKTKLIIVIPSPCFQLLKDWHPGQDNWVKCFCLAAANWDFKTYILDPTEGCPASQVCTSHAFGWFQ